ncbi:hypothetical protein Tco_0828321 [Tanacetum coccineum]
MIASHIVTLISSGNLHHQYHKLTYILIGTSKLHSVQCVTAVNGVAEVQYYRGRLTTFAYSRHTTQEFCKIDFGTFCDDYVELRRFIAKEMGTTHLWIDREDVSSHVGVTEGTQFRGLNFGGSGWMGWDYFGEKDWKVKVRAQWHVHSTIYVSNLKKCLSDKSLVIPMKELRLDDKLNFVEEPVDIMD